MIQNQNPMILKRKVDINGAPWWKSLLNACLSFLQFKAVTSFIKFCCYFLHSNKPIFGRLRMTASTQNYLNVVSLFSGIRQNHISDDICKNGLKHLWSWREVCRPFISHLDRGPVWPLQLAATSEEYLLLILSPAVITSIVWFCCLKYCHGPWAWIYN